MTYTWNGHTFDARQYIGVPNRRLQPVADEHCQQLVNTLRLLDRATAPTDVIAAAARWAGSVALDAYGMRCHG